MAPLEAHYRRLLAAYPRAHRQAYAEEMVAVLMAGARPGQRRPALGDVLNLLWSGLAARLGRGAEGLRSAAWRDAAAVAGLLGAIVLATIACYRLTLGPQYLVGYDPLFRALGLDGGQLLDPVLRFAGWLAVVVAALLGARRAAWRLGLLAVLAEVVAILAWLPLEQFRTLRGSFWLLMLALVTVGLLALGAPGRPSVRVVRHRGTVLLVAAITLAGLAATGLTRDVSELAYLSAATLLLHAVWSARPEVRHRVLVLLAPLAAVPVAQVTVEETLGLRVTASVTPEMWAAHLGLLAGIPAAALGVAVALLYLREHFNLHQSVVRTAGEEAA